MGGSSGCARRAEQQFRGDDPEFVFWLRNRSQGRVDIARQVDVVKADDGQLVGHGNAPVAGGGEGARSP